MKASKTLALALGAAVLAVPAYAADVIFQEPPIQPQPIVSMPVDTWTGGYVGLQAGYGFSGRVRDRTDGTSVATDGFYGGAFAGYNFQSGMMVFGGEADLNYSRIRGTGTIDGDPAARTRPSVDGSIRARAGVAVTDDILVYGTAGVAGERLRVTANGASDTNTMVGFTAGVGMDARLTDQVFGRVEYRYTQYGSQNFNFGGADQRIDSRNHRVGVGLGVKF